MYTRVELDKKISDTIDSRRRYVRVQQQRILL